MVEASTSATGFLCFHGQSLRLGCRRAQFSCINWEIASSIRGFGSHRLPLAVRCDVYTDSGRIPAASNILLAAPITVPGGLAALGLGGDHQGFAIDAIAIRFSQGV